MSTISPFHQATLRPDEALEIDARDVTRAINVVPPRFAKGFVVIESPCELDVVAVYTALPGKWAQSGLVFATERVPARKIEACLDLKLDISTGVADRMITSSPMTSINTPCQATVIQDVDRLASPLWATQAGSRWISARGAINFPPVFAPGWYLFQYCFTLCSGFTNPLLSLSVLVDDRAWVRLNGAWVVQPYSFFTPDVPQNYGGPPKALSVTSGFLPGRNCLELVVFNDVNGHPINPVSVNAHGTLTAERGACREGCGCCS